MMKGHMESMIPGLAREVSWMLRLHVGEECAVTRQDLLEKVNRNAGMEHASDRQLRMAIENLRENGSLICNVLTGDGYYLAESMEEYQEFRRKYASYATTIFERIRAMDKAAEQRWGGSALQMPLI